MGRLIDADALLQNLKDYVEKVYECDFDDPQCTANGGSTNPNFVEGLWEAKEIIEEQTTAYDVDKVVEQLQKCKKAYPLGTWCDMIEEALFIVKGGGQG
jgi:hypothetical protein